MDEPTTSESVPETASVTPAGQFDTIDIDGAEADAYVDYGETDPRMIIDLDSVDQVSLVEGENDDPPQVVIDLGDGPDKDQ